MITTKKTPIEILGSVRLGTADYDFNNAQIINEGGFGLILEIKSNVDGKTYVAKVLNFHVGSLNKSED